MRPPPTCQPLSGRGNLQPRCSVLMPWFLAVRRNSRAKAAAFLEPQPRGPQQQEAAKPRKQRPTEPSLLIYVKAY